MTNSQPKEANGQGQDWNSTQKNTTGTVPDLGHKTLRQLTTNRVSASEGSKTKKPELAVEISLEINKTLCATWLPAHIRIQRLAYNEKGNMKELTEPAAMSNMLLPLHRLLLLPAVRQCDSDIIDVTGDQT